MQETPPTATDAADETSPKRPIALWIACLLAAFVIGLGAGYLIWARPLQAELATANAALAAAQAQSAAAQAGAATQEAQAAAANPQQPVKRYDIPADDDPVRGSQNAPITIIEFSDYECPFCRRWHQEVLPQIQAKYGDQVRHVYRDFPLYSIHPNAGPAAEAANCAGEQDAYWDFSDLLFSGAQPLERSGYEAFAQELELDLAAFTQCLDDGRHKAEVDADFAYASELGVRSTPTFFINGLAVVGAQPFEVFEQIIDMELAGEIP
jgi:protein-disulfide isomerase